MSTPSIYPHEPATLLPLLRNHLPGSIRVYGALTSNSSSRPAYATFTSSQLENNDLPEIWVIIAPLPPPITDQIRLYSSLDHHPGKPELTESQQKDGLELVLGALTAYKPISPGGLKVGGLSSQWTAGLRELWGMKKKPTYWYWLAPEHVEVVASSQSRVNRDGLFVDIGREVDVDIIQSTCDVKRLKEYYKERLPHTTVIRPYPEKDGKPKQGVCWIVTHTDGAQGALYTMPEYRRRGLAKWVTEERLKKVKEEDRDARGFVCVAEGNEGSEGLWKGMGWERGWTVEWVY